MFWNKVELSEVDFSLPSVEFFNSEAGVGLMLDFEEDTENGNFVLKFTFPEKWHPQVENYNRWQTKSVKFCNKSLTTGFGPTWLGRLRSTSMGEGSSTPTLTSRWPPPSTCVGFCLLNWCSDLSEGSELPHLGERAGCGEEQEQWGGKKVKTIPIKVTIISKPPSNRPRSKWKYFAQLTTWPILRWLRLWICYMEEEGISTPPIGPSLHIFPPGNTTLSRHFNVRRKSRFVFTLFLLSAYHELDFSVEDRNTIYWHHTVPKYFPVKPTISSLKLSSGLVLRDQCATLAPLISWQSQPFLK